MSFISRNYHGGLAEKFSACISTLAATRVLYIGIAYTDLVSLIKDSYFPVVTGK